MSTGRSEVLKQLIVDQWQSLDEQQFNDCMTAHEKFTDMGLNFHLSPIVFVDSMRPVLSFQQRYEALCAWMNIPFPGIPEIWFPAIESGLLAKDYLDPAPKAPKIKDNLRLGEILVELRALTRRQLKRLLALQRIIADRTGIRALFGVLAVNQGLLTAGEYMHALAIQVGLPFNGIDGEVCENITRAINVKKRGGS